MAKQPGERGEKRVSKFVAAQLGVESATVHAEPVRTESGRIRYEEHVDQIVTHDGTVINL